MPSGTDAVAVAVQGQRRAVALYDLVQHGEVRLGGFLWRELRAKHLACSVVDEGDQAALVSTALEPVVVAAVDLHQLAHAGAALARAVHALGPAQPGLPTTPLHRGEGAKDVEVGRGQRQLGRRRGQVRRQDVAVVRVDDGRHSPKTRISLKDIFWHRDAAISPSDPKLSVPARLVWSHATYTVASLPSATCRTTQNR